LAAIAGAAMGAIAIAVAAGITWPRERPASVARPAALSPDNSSAASIRSATAAAADAAPAGVETAVLAPPPSAREDAAAPAESTRPPARSATPAHKNAPKPSHPESTRM
jgi:hypothetical protein